MIRLTMKALTLASIIRTLVMSESVFDNSVLRKFSVDQSALVIDTCGNDCEFEEELREVYKSCVSMAHLKRPQSLQSLPPDSIFTFVLIVADNEPNSVEVSKGLQMSSAIRPTTKIFIVLKSDREKNETLILGILNAFLKVHLLNVVVWQKDTIMIQFLSKGPPKLISRNKAGVTSEHELFPDKVKNLHGHALRLVQMQAAPYSVIVRDNEGRLRLDGTQEYLLELILQRMNATYKLKLVHSAYEILTSYQDGSGDFCLNKFSPFWKPLFGKCDFLSTLETDAFRIMVRSIRKNNVVRKTFFTREVWLNFLIVMAASLVYSTFFDTPQRRVIKNCFRFSQILLQTPVVIRVKQNSKRIFVSAVLLFCMVQSVRITSSITSKMVSYLPDSGINSIKDIAKSNISIYGNSYSVSVIKTLNLSLGERFVSRVEAVDAFPWNLNTTEEFAFIANTVVFRRYIELATYNDRHDKQRFRLFPGRLAKFPVNFVFPKNSPITEQIQRMYTLAEEAGLPERWSTMKLGLMKDWTYFKPSVYSGLKAEEYLNVMFVFPYLVCGQILSFVVFVLEVIVFRFNAIRERKKEPLQRIINLPIPYRN